MWIWEEGKVANLDLIQLYIFIYMLYLHTHFKIFIYKGLYIDFKIFIYVFISSTITWKSIPLKMHSSLKIQVSCCYHAGCWLNVEQSLPYEPSSGLKDEVVVSWDPKGTNWPWVWNHCLHEVLNDSWTIRLQWAWGEVRTLPAGNRDQGGGGAGGHPTRRLSRLGLSIWVPTKSTAECRLIMLDAVAPLGYSRMDESPNRSVE